MAPKTIAAVVIDGETVMTYDEASGVTMIRSSRLEQIQAVLLEALENLGKPVIHSIDEFTPGERCVYVGGPAICDLDAIEDAGATEMANYDTGHVWRLDGKAGNPIPGHTPVR